MNETSLFLSGLGATLASTLCAVGYLRGPLDRMLVELCGTAERARFWTAYSCVSLVLVPLIFALHVRPDLSDGGSAVLAVATQLKWALVGLVVTVTAVAYMLSRFIPRESSPAGPRAGMEKPSGERAAA